MNLKTLFCLIKPVAYLLTGYFWIQPQMAYAQNTHPAGSPIECSYVKPDKIIQTGHNHYFIDFGQDAFGTLQIDMVPTAYDTLIIHLGEKALDQTRVDPHPGGTIRYQKIMLPVTPSKTSYLIPLVADKRNTNPPAVALPDSFGVVMPFRYCEIEHLQTPLTESMIRQKTYHCPFNDQASSFICSDTILNQVWNLCKQTIKATSFCGLYIDGDRERIPYEADALINQLSHYAVDNEYAMARHTAEYFMKHPTWPTEWILMTAFLFYNDYEYTGDREALARNYNDLNYKSLIELERPDGLISTQSEPLTDEVMGHLGFSDRSYRIRDIVDWPGEERDGYVFTATNTVVNAFYYKNLLLMSAIAGALEKPGDSIYFAQKAIRVRDTINSKLLDPVRGIYRDGEATEHASLHANLFPLVFGLVPVKQQPTVISYIKSKGMACSVYAAQFLLDGLYRFGEADYAQGLMASTGSRSWWNMIREGSTLTMEAWGMQYKANGDWNHAWGAAPANIITRCLWGITPAQPGFKRAQIRPQPGNLTFSQIQVPTIRGSIRAKYVLSGQQHQQYTIELPEGMDADFVFNPTNRSIVRVNNRIIPSGKPSIRLSSGVNQIDIQTE